MLKNVFASIGKNKVRLGVIIFYSIKMMNNLRRFKVATKVLLHNKAVFPNIPSFCRKRMIWKINMNITSIYSDAALPRNAFFSSKCFVKSHAAGLGAILLFFKNVVVRNAEWFSAIFTTAIVYHIAYYDRRIRDCQR